MAEMLQFVRPDESLDPEALVILCTAYDRAIRAIEVMQDGRTSDIVREIIAGRIIYAGRRGERDPDTLRKLALRDI